MFVRPFPYYMNNSYNRYFSKNFSGTNLKDEDCINKNNVFEFNEPKKDCEKEKKFFGLIKLPINIFGFELDIDDIIIIGLIAFLLFQECNDEILIVILVMLIIG